jgi:hypothetical protein
MAGIGAIDQAEAILAGNAGTIVAASAGQVPAASS